MQRRSFLSTAALSAPILNLLSGFKPLNNGKVGQPIVISTWKPNMKANAAAWQVLAGGGKALDAVHQGVQVPEADPTDQSVGYGGLPDRDGIVTLDACIMDHEGNCGSVMGLEEIMHAISVAKLVMEKTPHVQLVGDGALQFALEMGFAKINLLTPQSKEAYENWRKQSKYNPMTTVNNLLERIEKQHDTIGMLALDELGNLAGACSTSGMAFKMHGRVGDSPIIGAGLFVDNEIGAASATGVGEEVVRICGSHTVVEMMRHGYSPEEACEEAVKRLVKVRGEQKTQSLQIGMIAINKKGQVGCFSLNKDFTMAVHSQDGPSFVEAKYHYH